MSNEAIIEKTCAFVEQKFSGEGSGHDYWHMYRVWQLARRIAQSETAADPFVVELAALLHEFTDTKFVDDGGRAGEQEIITWLESNDVSNTTISQVLVGIKNTSFSSSIGAGSGTQELQNIAAQIVSDADKLDALGAIGIARTFAYGGNKHRQMYDPARPPEQYADATAYHQSDSPSINHFYEKLLLLKDRMFTETGKKIAQARHEYMEQFLAEFYDEWDGKR